MKNEKYFLNYDPKEDCYYLKKTSKYEINDWGYYVVNNKLYSKKNKMVFDTLEEAEKELKKVNKIIKRKWGRIK